MCPEPGVYNKEFPCIFEVVTKKYMKIIYEKDPKFQNMLRHSLFIPLPCIFIVLIYAS
jgi:hypothetical protein